MVKFLYQKAVEGFRLFFNYSTSAFAAQTAFFLVISAFPLAMLIISLLGYLPGLHEQMLQHQLSKILPGLFNEFSDEFFKEIYNRQTITLISITAFSSLFAASKGFVSVIRGINIIHGIQEKRNYFVVRGMAVLCTLGLMASIILSLMLMVFGQKLSQVLIHFFPTLEQAAFLFVSFRSLLLFIILTTFFLLLYVLVPSQSTGFREQLPGAVCSALGWILFSMLYSFFLTHVSRSIYGNLTSAVFIMLWLYACIYILFIGAKLNVLLKKGPYIKGE